MVYSVRVYVQMIYHINIPVFTNWRNKIYYMYFQHIEMSCKLWVHSPQGIYNLQNYITIAHLNIRYHGILHLEYFVCCIPCTQWTNYHFQSIAMSNRHSTGILGVFLYLYTGRQAKQKQGATCLPAITPH